MTARRNELIWLTVEEQAKGRVGYNDISDMSLFEIYVYCLHLVVVSVVTSEAAEIKTC